MGRDRWREESTLGTAVVYIQWQFREHPDEKNARNQRETRHSRIFFFFFSAIGWQEMLCFITYARNTGRRNVSKSSTSQPSFWSALAPFLFSYFLSISGRVTLLVESLIGIAQGLLRSFFAPSFPNSTRWWNRRICILYIYLLLCTIRFSPSLLIFNEMVVDIRAERSSIFKRTRRVSRLSRIRRYDFRLAVAFHAISSSQTKLQRVVNRIPGSIGESDSVEPFDRSFRDWRDKRDVACRLESRGTSVDEIVRFACFFRDGALDDGGLVSNVRTLCLVKRSENKTKKKGMNRNVSIFIPLFNTVLWLNFAIQ